MNRNTKLFTLILGAVLAVGALALPALAQGGGSGTIDGEIVNIDPPLTNQTATRTFEFSSTTITAAVADDQAGTYDGEVQNVAADGTEVDGNCSGGSGTVDSLTFSGTDPLGNTISGSGTGTFDRVGTNVVATINGTGELNGVALDFTIVLEVEFIPTDGDCVNSPATEALLEGTFQATTS